MHRPIFFEHNNTDPLRSRGVIVDAQVHVEDAKTSGLDPFYSSQDARPEHLPPTWVELLLEIDAQTYPKFAQAFIDGDIDAVSMGANVKYTKCTVCANVAHDMEDFCIHVRHRGAYYDSRDDKGQKTSCLAAELCYGIGFFEISGVITPADSTALVDPASISHKRAIAAELHKEAEKPRVDQTTAPDKVDTLRQDVSCELCGNTMRDGKCSVCAWTSPPSGLDDPDLQRAKEVDKKVQEQKALNELQNRQQPNNQDDSGEVMSEGKAAKVAAVNPKEKPILPPSKKRSDQPQNVRVVKDSLKPVESTVQKKSDPAVDDIKSVDVEGVGTALPDNEPGHEDVNKEVDVKGFPTTTWGIDEGNTLGQADPVTTEVFPKDSSMDKEALETQAEDPATSVDVTTPPKEEVGPHTETWSTPENDPVTQEEGVGGGPIGESAAKASNFILAMQVADTEVELGLAPSDERYARAAALEGEDKAVLDARLEVMTKVKTAGLTRMNRVASAGRLPSFNTMVTEPKNSDLDGHFGLGA